MTEEWRPVVGYEGLYEVSNLGRVRSLDRVTARGHRLRGCVRKPNDTGRGYMQVELSRDGHKQSFYVQRLVLEAFVGARPPGMEACHNDGSRSNNRLENLRWDTHAENEKDRVRHGTHNESRKTHCPSGHPYDDANTYRSSSGRQCRTCRRDRRRPQDPDNHLTRKEEPSG